jgi:hypothetical protein
MMPCHPGKRQDNVKKSSKIDKNMTMFPKKKVIGQLLADN